MSIWFIISQEICINNSEAFDIMTNGIGQHTAFFVALNRLTTITSITRKGVNGTVIYSFAIVSHLLGDRHCLTKYHFLTIYRSKQQPFFSVWCLVLLRIHHHLHASFITENLESVRVLEPILHGNGLWRRSDIHSKSWSLQRGSIAIFLNLMRLVVEERLA